MFGPLPVPGKGVGGRKRDNPRRGEVHTEGKTWRGGLWIFQRRTCCVVAGCHRHDYPNKLYRYQGGGEGETRADYREIEPRALVGGPLFIIIFELFVSFLCRDNPETRCRGRGERRFAVLTIPIDPSRGMEKKKISLSVELGWVKFREQRLFGRIFFRGGCRWFKMARSEWYIYIKFVENFLVRKL